jgi:hypothetical protein
VILWVFDSSAPKIYEENDDANEVAPCTSPKWVFLIQELPQRN